MRARKLADTSEGGGCDDGLREARVSRQEESRKGESAKRQAAKRPSGEFTGGVGSARARARGEVRQKNGR